MNWTGGSLQRHSRNAQRNAVKRQKEHFAKARTALQSGSSVSAVPFRPSYLPAEDMSVRGQLPPFGMGSIHHRGHPHELSSDDDSRYERSPREDRRYQEPRRIPNEGSGVPAPGKIAQVHQFDPDVNQAEPSSPEICPNTGGHPADVDVEQRLLEAKRRRLLQQQDWAGLGPSRPVKMHFTSIREKQKIGKRRKIASRPCIPTDTRRLPCNVLAHDAAAYRVADMHHAWDGLDNIRIRIGTEALASQTSAQPSEHARSCQAEDDHTVLSDPMLFDHEGICSSPGELRAISRSVSEKHGHYESWMGEGDKVCRDAQRVQTDHFPARSTSSATTLDTPPRENILNGLKNDPREWRPGPQATSPSLKLLAHGTRKPFRLIFDSSEGATGAGSLEVGKTSQGHVPHETTACSDANATSSELSYMKNREGDRMASSPIIDDRQWGAFARNPHASSDGSADSLSQDAHPYAGEGKGGETNACGWSQYATVGDQTCHPTSSPISASLPSIKRANEQWLPQHMPFLADKGGTGGPGYQSHGIDESERLWRTFVFAELDGLTPGSMHGDDSNSPIGRMTMEDWPSKKTSCVAVASAASSMLYGVDQSPRENRWLND